MYEIEGYVVASYHHDALRIDWDSPVHATLSAGQDELTNCLAKGYGDYKLYELRPVDTGGGA
jgi:hypothetical protein